MTLHVALTHRTQYRYDRLVGLGPHVIRLRPAPHCRTPILSYSLSLTPKTHFINWQQDPFGNFLARVVVPDKADELSATVDLVADMAVINPFDFFVEECADLALPLRGGAQGRSRPLPAPLPPGPRLSRYLADLKIAAPGTIDHLCDLNRRLAGDIEYLIRMEPGVQTPEETLEKRSGSCRDTAWLLVQILRQTGLAARFVSGYLIQLTPDVKPLDGPAGAASDFTDLHAWAEVYVPGAGWIGLDPTSGLLAGEGHIPLAATPHPVSAAPITGGHDPAEVEFSVHMEVRRIAETPRVTKPYSEAQWTEICTAGHEVDRRLQAGDVRLTMGGEPTFVSIDDMEGAEWNTAAAGPTKRRYAETLIRRLRDRFAPGGLMHFGQGKWYPGEQLPRWSFALYWRGDGQPLWNRPELIDREEPAAPATIADAQRFTESLTAQLGLPADSVVTAYEDPGHFALAEQRLPLNLDPATNKLEDPCSARAPRARVRARARHAGRLRAAHPGLAPRTAAGAGHGALELPARAAVPHARRLARGVQAAARLAALARSARPARDRGTRPVRGPDTASRAATLLMQRRAETQQAPPSPPSRGGDIAGAVRTALAIEPRDGHLCVFMPPLEDAEDYAALVAAVEEAALATAARSTSKATIHLLTHASTSSR